MYTQTRRIAALLSAITITAGGLLYAEQHQLEPQHAPPPPPPDQQNDLRMELQRIQQEAQQLQQTLDQIAMQATQQTPALMTKQDELQELYQEKLQEHGYPTEQQLAELQDMQHQLQQDADMDTQEREQLIRRFQQEVTEMQQAQAQAHQDREVQQAIQAYEADRLDAMREVNPQAPAMQQQLDEYMQTIEQMQQALMQPAH